jgi:hypothetical protein
MNTRLRIKGFIWAVCFFAYSFKAMGNDAIRFTWIGGINKGFGIVPTGGKFVIDWGDYSAVDTIIGKGNYIRINHTYNNTNNYNVTLTAITTNCSFTYLECPDNQMIDLDLTASPALRILNCSNNCLTALHISENTALMDLSCYNNCLQLSDLYNITKKMDNQSQKQLGTQRLARMEIAVDGSVNFFMQEKFNGIRSTFTVEENGLPVSFNDYAIANGVISFFKKGIYTITITHPAIVSNPSYPTKAIVDVYVGVVGIENHYQEVNTIKIYPNPTNGQLRIANYELQNENIEFFDVVGQKVYEVRGTGYEEQDNTRYQEPRTSYLIDVSHLANGLYFLKIGNRTARFMKE